MSYILDAIKKSDQQRDLGTTPDVHTIHETPAVEPSRRPAWLYGLAAILLLNAGAITWWLWPGHGAKTPVAQTVEKSAVAQDLPPKQAAPPQQQSVKTRQPPAPAAKTPSIPPPPPAQVVSSQEPATSPPPVVEGEGGAPQSPPVSIPPPPPTPQSAISAVPPQPVQPAAPSATNAAIQPAVVQAEAKKPPIVPPPPSVPIDKAKTAAARGKENTAPPKAANPAAKASPVAVVPVQTPSSQTPPPAAIQEEPVAEVEAPPAAEEGLGTEAAAPSETVPPIVKTPTPKSKSKKTDKENEDPELAKIPLLNQLPPDIQQAVPEMHISFHSYSIKPAARLVSISGKILREGEEFDDAVKLETITTQGVVMKVKDRRFRLKVNPSSRL